MKLRFIKIASILGVCALSFSGILSAHADPGVDSDGDTSSAVITDDPSTAASALPELHDDSATTTAEAAVWIGVLENDLGSDLVLASVGQAEHGTVSLDVDASGISYWPEKGYSGPDSFTYTVTGQDGATATATVNIKVLPDGIDDFETTYQGQPITIDPEDLLANDKGQGLTLVSVQDPKYGEVAIQDGKVVFTPDPEYAGDSAGFTYGIQGPSADYQGTGIVSITVLGPMIINDDAISMVNDTTDYPLPANLSEVILLAEVFIDVLDNDTSTLPLTITEVSSPSHGDAKVYDIDNVIRYLPMPGFVGVDTFTYTVTDTDGRTGTATVTVTVEAPTPSIEIQSGGMSVSSTAPLGGIALSLIGLGVAAGVLGLRAARR